MATKEKIISTYKSIIEESGEKKGLKIDEFELVIKEYIMSHLKQGGFVPLQKGDNFYHFKDIDVLFWKIINEDEDIEPGLYISIEPMNIKQDEVITISFVFANNEQDELIIKKRLEQFHMMNSYYLLSSDNTNLNRYLHNNFIEVYQIHIKMKDVIAYDYNIVNFIGI